MKNELTEDDIFAEARKVSLEEVQTAKRQLYSIPLVQRQALILFDYITQLENKIEDLEQQRINERHHNS